MSSYHFARRDHAFAPGPGMFRRIVQYEAENLVYDSGFPSHPRHGMFELLPASAYDDKPDDDQAEVVVKGTTNPSISLELFRGREPCIKAYFADEEYRSGTQKMEIIDTSASELSDAVRHLLQHFAFDPSRARRLERNPAARRRKGKLRRNRLLDQDDLDYMRPEVGSTMMQYHVGQGDPVYMVASYYVAGREYPDLDVMSEALSRLESIDTDSYGLTDQDIELLTDAIIHLDEELRARGYAEHLSEGEYLPNRRVPRRLAANDPYARPMMRPEAPEFGVPAQHEHLVELDAAITNALGLGYGVRFHQRGGEIIVGIYRGTRKEYEGRGATAQKAVSDALPPNVRGFMQRNGPRGKRYLLDRGEQVMFVSEPQLKAMPLKNKTKAMKLARGKSTTISMPTYDVRVVRVE